MTSETKAQRITMLSKPINKEGRLKILSWNICSLHKNMHYLKTIIALHQPSIITLQEAINSADQGKRQLNITGYNQIRSAAKQNNHILLTYVKKGIQFSHLPHTTSKHSIDTIKISIKHTPATYTITNVYRPPQWGVELDTDTLEHVLTNNVNNIITGDFNLAISENPANAKLKHAQLDEVINNYELHTCNKDKEPTFIQAKGKSSTIDHILHDNELDNDLINFKTLTDYGTLKQYHRPILATYRLDITHEPEPTRHSRNLNEKIYREAVKKARSNHPTITIRTKEDIDKAAKRIDTIVNEAYDEALPKKLPKNKKSTYWTPSNYLKYLYKRKEKAGQAYKQHECHPEAEYFKLVRETICEEIEQQTEKEIEKNFTKAVNKIKQQPRNGRLFHREIKKLAGLTSRSEHASTLKHNGITANTAEEKPEIHLKYQEQVFTENEPENENVRQRFAQLEDDNDLFLNDDSEPEFEPIDIDEIRWTLGTTD